MGTDLLLKRLICSCHLTKTDYSAMMFAGNYLQEFA